MNVDRQCRGVGWNIRSAQIPPAVPSSYPRNRWLGKSSIRLFMMYLGCDLTSSILNYTAVNEPFFDQPLLWQVFFAWTKALRSYYIIEASYCMVAVPAVLFRVSSPQMWPPMTGSFRKDACTVRKTWGTCWHQVMRRACSEAGRIVKAICGFRKGGFLSRYSQIWVGFALSASSHHAGAVTGCFDDKGFWQVMFFMVQPAGIMFEDLMIWLGKKMSLKENGECLLRSFGLMVLNSVQCGRSVLAFCGSSFGSRARCDTWWPTSRSRGSR